MSEQSDGGPAFPCDSTSKQYPTQEGMSLRDWFAGQALAGIVASPRLLIVLNEQKQDPASCAYDLAEFMLHERSKRNDN